MFNKSLNKGFNKILNIGLSNFILLCGVVFLSACAEEKYSGNHIEKKIVDTSVKIKKVNLTEYIIILKNSVKITAAINSLKKYNIQIIKDLKRGRYLIGFKNDPGIEQLQKDIIDSTSIKHIQPNFRYTTQ